MLNVSATSHAPKWVNDRSIMKEEFSSNQFFPTYVSLLLGIKGNGRMVSTTKHSLAESVSIHKPQNGTLLYLETQT